MSTAIAKAFGLDKAENTRQARESFYDLTAEVARVAREMMDSRSWDNPEMRADLRSAIKDQLDAQERMLAAMGQEDEENTSDDEYLGGEGEEHPDTDSLEDRDITLGSYAT